jgi:hypothetical protein
LVGIAGEDDVDAPDLLTPDQNTSVPSAAKGNGDAPKGPLHSPQTSPEVPSQTAPLPQAARRERSRSAATAAATLSTEHSAKLTASLLLELAGLTDGDDAALWAQRRLPEKNKLITAHEIRIEEAFQSKLASFVASPARDPSVSDPLTTRPSRTRRRAIARQKQRPAKTVNKAALTIPKPHRVRDREHVRFVARQPCLVCGRMPCDAHHLRFVQPRALGRKVSDEFTVPLCRGHHREAHRCGDEAAWWQRTSIDPTAAARRLWLEAHPRSRS